MIKIIVTIEYTIQPATGPNQHRKALELLDGDGDRYSYIDSVDDAVDDINALIEATVAVPFDVRLDA